MKDGSKPVAETLVYMQSITSGPTSFPSGESISLFLSAMTS